jgi:DNA invertase Pin-like site-specific DNA recombinase
VRIGYARVSSDEQADALQPQVARLDQAGCDRIVTDIESGTRSDREGLIEVMALIKAGGITELVITRVDRLGRDAAYVDQLLGLCEASGTTIRALDGGIVETATPQGFLMARLLTSMAEMESRMLSLRLRRQFETYRTQGRHLRGRKPFGYQGGADHRLEPHPAHWASALRIIDELRTHRNFTRVANSLPAWCPWTPHQTNLQGWFCNPVIRGHLPYIREPGSGKGWRARWRHILYDQHPALISENEWRDLARQLQQTQNRFAGRPTVDARHGLTGLLRCHACHQRLRRSTSNGTPWWRCCNRVCTDRGRVKEAIILEAVIRCAIAAAEDLAAAVAAPPEENPILTVKLADLEQLRELSRRNPHNTAILAAMAEAESEIRRLRQPNRNAPDPAFYRALRDPVFFAEATAEQQRAIFGAVLLDVLVGPGGEPITPIARL